MRQQQSKDFLYNPVKFCVVHLISKSPDNRDQRQQQLGLRDRAGGELDVVRREELALHMVRGQAVLSVHTVRGETVLSITSSGGGALWAEGQPAPVQ